MNSSNPYNKAQPQSLSALPKFGAGAKRYTSAKIWCTPRSRRCTLFWNRWWQMSVVRHRLYTTCLPSKKKSANGKQKPKNKSAWSRWRATRWQTKWNKWDKRPHWSGWTRRTKTWQWEIYGNRSIVMSHSCKVILWIKMIYISRRCRK
jgi:hypothetical protein